MIPQIPNATTGRIRTTRHPSHTYRFTDTQIVGNADGLNAVRQAVYHCLSTERYAYPIYSRNYGIELERYIGRGFDYLETTIETTLRDALLQDDRIRDVTVTGVTQTGTDSAEVRFDVVCDNGTFGTEVIINV